MGLTNIFHLYIRKAISNREIVVNNNTLTHKNEINKDNQNEFLSTHYNQYLVNKDIILKWNDIDYLSKIEIYSKYIKDFNSLSDNELTNLTYKILNREELNKSNQFSLTSDNYYYIIYSDIFGNKYKLYLEIDKTPITLDVSGVNDKNKSCSYVSINWSEDEYVYKAIYQRLINNKVIDQDKYYRNREFYLPGLYRFKITDNAGNITWYEFEISNDPIIYNLVDKDNNKFIKDKIITNKILTLLKDNPNYKYYVSGELLNKEIPVTCTI